MFRLPTLRRASIVVFEQRCKVTKPELIKRLEGMFDQMQRERSFGQIAIAFRDGEPDFIRKETTEKLGAQGNSHAKTTRSY